MSRSRHCGAHRTAGQVRLARMEQPGAFCSPSATCIPADLESREVGHDVLWQALGPNGVAACSGGAQRQHGEHGSAGLTAMCVLHSTSVCLRSSQKHTELVLWPMT